VINAGKMGNIPRAREKKEWKEGRKKSEGERPRAQRSRRRGVKK
jgi:hypothetical protein